MSHGGRVEADRPYLAKTYSRKMPKSRSWAHLIVVLIAMLLSDTAVQWVETRLTVTGMRVPSGSSHVSMEQMRVHSLWTPPSYFAETGSNEEIALKKRSPTYDPRTWGQSNDYFGPLEVMDARNVNDEGLKKTIERQATSLFDDETALSRMIQQMDAYYLTYGRPR
ncbi:hypothetical protein FBUS_06200 [Fasciolopsis buskii]|uniref:Uncharacterized protein n=1 Tax=Fasciolopsis buskii TaxID=27845 RepID=A0A8E0RYF7_9TREM|nr:hypothetical protein FBUS_06200 [Fasciolopsis buski]